MADDTSVLHLSVDRRERIRRVILAAVVGGVPAYRNGFDRAGEHHVMDRVMAAIDTFVEAAGGGGVAMDQARSMAFELGRIQARIGRGLDDLLAAYRVGTRAAWHEYADAAHEEGLDARQVGDLASALFGFVDQVSAASIAGHAEGVSSVRRDLEQARERFADLMVQSAAAEDLRDAADAARAHVPETVTVVVAARHDLARVASVTPAGAVVASIETAAGAGVVVLPDLSVSRRARLLTDLASVQACVGPTVPTRRAATSLRLAERSWDLGAVVGVRDVDEHLLDCVLAADREAVDLLWDTTMAPLSELSERKVEALTDTLRSWLLNLGQRGAVARELGVHPQTVRYRMDQVREAFGPRWANPAEVERIVVCLAARPGRRSSARA